MTRGVSRVRETEKVARRTDMERSCPKLLDWNRAGGPKENDQHGAWLGKTRHGDQGVVHLSSCCDYEGGVWLDKIACLTQVGTRGKGDVLWPGNTVSQNLPKSWWDRTSYDRHEFLPQQSQPESYEFLPQQHHRNLQEEIRDSPEGFQGIRKGCA
ncbi:hypothetical protein FA13DRAFT_1719060 [Coprinellus micaceus]|uniref:Uncharacterized protein n=1 Tax=Coprinellus micaceus TaxID=71717 RepID=A0A4Y7SCL5_COPMI|nr:hypothetical protein FA13DRAFT_1719060 [Coprinellus micaceus]